MRLEKIITLANKKVLFRFLAMERSLRATGCKLPLWVIPYDEDQFTLPDNATWWSMPEIQDWLQEEKVHAVYRKYQCLTTSHYQFIDSDAIFLRNPEDVLADENGFIASCGHWRDAGHAITIESRSILRGISTLWQQRVFNSGQFACDQVLYTVDELKRQCLDPRYVEICLRCKFHEQPALNLLVNLSGVPIRNLTLPPTAMESTWAGDYTDGNYAAYWKSEAKKPYLLHWAGCNSDLSRPIDRLFLDQLTVTEREQFQQETANLIRQRAKDRAPSKLFVRRLLRSVRAFISEWSG